MWTAVRIIEQNSRLLDRLISECVQRRQEPMAATYRRRKAEVDAQSAQIREYLVSQHRAALALEPEESSVVGESAAATD
jgi:Na+/phosphate symporter